MSRDFSILDIVLPDVYSFFFNDVHEVNGSSPTGNCSNTQRSGIRTICEAVNSSVLFDGFIPTLNFSSDTWASQLFVLNNTTDLITEWDSDTTLSRIEVVMFNCPKWGIAAQSISFFALKGHGIVGSIDLTNSTTSCDFLVTVCFQVQKMHYSFGVLQFSLLSNSQRMSIAEVRFYSDSDCSQDFQSMPSKDFNELAIVAISSFMREGRGMGTRAYDSLL